MCTLSFVPTENGYCAAMNRDEHLERETALPPRLLRGGNLMAIYPQEASGGTWIASNECGITLALLNWNLPLRGMDRRRSRGCLIPQLIVNRDSVDLEEALNSLRLDGLPPFRLVGIIPREQELREWQWNTTCLEQTSFSWHARHWFSSGLSDQLAGQYRGEACQRAWEDTGAGSLPWLRRLHQSHFSRQGPFSICVHRPEAGTVSYSEIIHDHTRLTFRYSAGHPCENHPLLGLDMPLVHDDLVVL